MGTAHREQRKVGPSKGEKRVECVRDEKALEGVRGRERRMEHVRINGVWT